MSTDPLDDDDEDLTFADALDFHYPAHTKQRLPHYPYLVHPTEPQALDYDDPDELHRQLLEWLLVQRFWTGVLNEVYVKPAEYQCILSRFTSFETLWPHLVAKVTVRQRGILKYGSTRYWDYPPFILKIFSVYEKFSQHTTNVARKAGHKVEAFVPSEYYTSND